MFCLSQVVPNCLGSRENALESVIWWNVDQYGYTKTVIMFKSMFEQELFDIAVLDTVLDLLSRMYFEEVREPSKAMLAFINDKKVF